MNYPEGRPGVFDSDPGYTPEAKRLHWLLDSGEFSDLVLMCGNMRYYVHKAVVLVQSTVFYEKVIMILCFRFFPY